MEKRSFDVTNCIVVWGEVHALTTKEEACPDHPSNNPCEMCSLHKYCSEGNKTLCSLFDASINEFFYSVGVLKGVDRETCVIRPNVNWLLDYNYPIDFECE